MALRKSRRPDLVESDRITRQRLRLIGERETYAGADPRAVETRIRNMHYGATNNRLSQIRRGEAEAFSALSTATHD